MRMVTLAASAVLAFSGTAGAQPPGPGSVACADLLLLDKARLGDSSARVTQASAVPAGMPTADAGSPPLPAMPAHCEVFGKIAERTGRDGQTYAIRFHMRLPTDWNGRFFFQGGGGSNGVVGAAYGILLGAQPRTALNLGYAVVSQDSGMTTPPTTIRNGKAHRPSAGTRKRGAITALPRSGQSPPLQRR